eukprot:TRINITY_DN4688_c0_g1_i2.p1 TRINITY_DN4688_c0_g1~~TRINITY_DN4688_c0_g1_i2.p1  ORF type:complete len:194 (-),score=36.28 TRINITY_DN4688_c0_g1_i2:290-850(-)
MQPVVEYEDDETSHLLVPLDPSLIAKSESVLDMALAQRELYLQMESAETAADINNLCPDNLKSLEHLCLEVFEEDEGVEMRLLSVRDVHTHLPVGYILWRNVPQDEIHEWAKIFGTPGAIRRAEIQERRKRRDPPKYLLSQSSQEIENDDFSPFSLLKVVGLKLSSCAYQRIDVVEKLGVCSCLLP